MELRAITNGYAIYKSKGKIIAEPITQGAKAVLDWYVHNVPANHEYGYTGNETPALETLGLTADDVVDNPVLNRAFCRAAREIKNQDL